ncbi:hypothetical protein FF125_02680 [Aureibaculum algae]|uniref:Spore coat protein CotH n=1 Tax=Aureibaculum algae TaxID=2584122 RepID=A0A5B7TS08_9FLAO|nr:CotH kinase family protein [Aureibaculum algae]QCX37392.1 hypothetical protein FF125_02680 [Aureibaculum algae]
MKFRLLSILITLLTLTSCDNSPEKIEPEAILNPEDRLIQIEINTKNATIVDEPKINAQINISKNEIVSYDGAIGIEIRGASSQSFPKKSYGFETRDENNDDLNVSLLEFPEEEDWILYGPYSDKSLIRNMLIYDLSRDIDMYASRTEFVELSINNTNQGVYVFMEKLKRDKNRIDINKLKEDENSGEDVTGGYILKIDKIAGTNLGDGYNDLNSFTSSFDPPNATNNQKTKFLFEYPDAEDITYEQKTYISTYISDFESALISDDFSDPISGYKAYIEISSFIDFFLLNELSNNVDGYRLSTYIHKDKNKKLKMGPIWDFNLAFGNADYCGGGETNVWAYKFNERCPNDTRLIPFWWKRLLEDADFVNQLKNRWNDLRGSIFSDAYILSRIEEYNTTLTKAGAINANFFKWNILGSYVWPNNFVGTTYNSEENYLKNWITQRLSWLDSSIEGL